MEEIKLVLELVQKSLKNEIVPKKRKKKKPKQLRNTTYHEKLASLFNAELKRRSEADHYQFIASRMTLKKKAHISDYFKRADEGLQLEAARNRWKCENENNNGECPGAKRQKK